MQVSLLKLNAGIARAVETSATLERQNAELEAPSRGSPAGERIRGAAPARHGRPAARATSTTLRVRPRRDAADAPRAHDAPPQLGRAGADGRRRPSDRRRPPRRSPRHGAGDRRPTRRPPPRPTRPRRPPPRRDRSRQRRDPHAAASPRTAPSTRPGDPPPPTAAPTAPQPGPAAAAAPRAATAAPRATARLTRAAWRLDRAAHRPPLRASSSRARPRRRRRALLARRRPGPTRCSSAAATQQKARRRRPRPARHDHRPPRRRARGLPAGDDVAATPVPDQATRCRSPRQARAAARTPAGRRPRARSPTSDTGFVYLARKLPRPRARAGRRRSNIEGLEFIPRVPPRLPARLARLAAARLRRHRQHRASPASSTRTTELLRGARRRAPRSSRTRSATRSSCATTQAAEPGQRRAAHARRRDPGPRRGGARRGRARSGKPKGATAIVMDPRDGELLALANWPRVDANDAGEAPDYARRTARSAPPTSPARRSRRSRSPARSRTARSRRTPSSTSRRQIQVADREIGEAHDARLRSRSTTRRSSQQSSNVGAIMIGQRLGATRFDYWVRRFGFGKPTGVDLPGEEQRASCCRVEQYSGSSMGNLPIGQGLAVTPMQMATAYAAIANGGILRPPHIVEAVGGRAARRARGPPRDLRRRPPASLRQMLEGVLGPGGTASGAAIPGYELAGKTGTAEKPDPVTGGYSETKYVASFVGFAPAKHPRLLVAVMVDEPQGDIYGGSVAAPGVARDHELRAQLPADPARVTAALPPDTPAARTSSAARPAQVLRRGGGRAGPRPRRAARRGRSRSSDPTAPARRRRSRSSRASASATAARSRCSARIRRGPARRGGRGSASCCRRSEVPRLLTVARGADAVRRLLPRAAPGGRDDRARRARRRRPTSAARKLSGGQRRRLDVALALIGDPELLFLDEPTTGFDPAARREAWEVIDSLRELGKTIFLTTHYMEEAQRLADRVAIIRGRRGSWPTGRPTSWPATSARVAPRSASRPPGAELPGDCRSRPRRERRGPRAAHRARGRGPRACCAAGRPSGAWTSRASRSRGRASRTSTWS